ncbi:hypothetical protein [Spirosoma gilvum]
MYQNKVSSSIIVDKIRASRTNFDVSTDGLLQLLNAKVSSSVIEAMMQGTKMTDILTNVDVIKLTDANMPRKLMFQKINGSRTQFDTSTSGLIQLKAGKVPDAIQKIMMAAPTVNNSELIPATSSKSAQKVSPQKAENDMKGVRCRSWVDKFTKKDVTVSRVILRGRKAGNILLGRSASTLAGIEDMEVTLLFRRDNQNTVLVLYATKPGINNLLVERNKTLMFLMADDSVLEFKPIMDSEYGVDFDYTGYNLDSKLCVYYNLTQEQLQVLTKKLIKNYRLNTYNRHTHDDTVNQSRAEQVQVAARCMLGEISSLRE